MDSDLEEIVRGELEALMRLHVRFGQQLWALAFGLTGDRNLAESVLVDAYLEVWREATRKKVQRMDASQWLREIVERRCRERKTS